MKNQDLGLLANGSSGPWEVSIDETLTGLERWFAQIEGPLISLCFEISSLEIVAKVVRFLKPLATGKGQPSRRGGGSFELVLSKASQTPVSLVRDDEFDDRCFVLVGRADSPIIRCSLTGADSHHILKALDQVKKDLPRKVVHAIGRRVSGDILVKSRVVQKRSRRLG